MFLRWKNKTRKGKQTKGKITISPVIVESYWKEGIVKQRVVKYLGSIREEDIPRRDFAEWFWKKVNSNLRSIKVPPRQRTLFMAKINEVVTNPFLPDAQ